MNAFRFPTRSRFVRASLPAVLAMGALAVLSSAAQAAEPAQEITITGTRVEQIPYDVTVRRPAKEVTVGASVPANLDGLTLNSGVALLQDSVHDAALKVCLAADPRATATSDATTDCVHRAVRDAQPQIDALVAKARREAKGLALN
jgi:UrcA family protein